MVVLKAFLKNLAEKKQKPKAVILNISGSFNTNEIITDYFCNLIDALNVADAQKFKQKIKDRTYQDLIIISNSEANTYFSYNIKKIFEELSLSTFEALNLRFIVIDGVDKLNKQSSNSLLKLIEEPAENTYLLFLATNYNMVLPTITSRCLFFNLANKKNKIEWNKQNPKLHKALIEANYEANLINEYLEDSKIKNLFKFSETWYENLTTKKYLDVSAGYETKFINLSYQEINLVIDFLLYFLINTRKNNDLKEQLLNLCKDNNLSLNINKRLIYLTIISLFKN